MASPFCDNVSGSESNNFGLFLEGIIDDFVALLDNESSMHRSLWVYDTSTICRIMKWVSLSRYAGEAEKLLRLRSENLCLGILIEDIMPHVKKNLESEVDKESMSLEIWDCEKTTKLLFNGQCSKLPIQHVVSPEQLSKDCIEFLNAEIGRCILRQVCRFSFF